MIAFRDLFPRPAIVQQRHIALVERKHLRQSTKAIDQGDRAGRQLKAKIDANKMFSRKQHYETITSPVKSGCSNQE